MIPFYTKIVKLPDGQTEIRCYTKRENLHEWDKNPRSVTEGGRKRLKKYLKEYGQFKALLVIPDGTILGGNKRLGVFEEEKIDEIWISFVQPKNLSEMIGISLADNDTIGFYIETELNKLLDEAKDLNRTDFNVAIAENVSAAGIGQTNKINHQDEWSGLPAFTPKPTPLKLIISFRSAEDRQKFVEEKKVDIQSKLKQVWVTWWPYKDREDLGSLQYGEEDDET